MDKGKCEAKEINNNNNNNKLLLVQLFKKEHLHDHAEHDKDVP